MPGPLIAMYQTGQKLRAWKDIAFGILIAISIVWFAVDLVRFALTVIAD